MNSDEITSGEPLSPEQERLWFLDALQPNRPDYNVGMVARYRGSLDVDFLNDSIADLVERHSQLRSVIVSNGGVPQSKCGDSSGVSLSVIDLASSENPESLATQSVEARMSEPFDLSTGPLAQFTLFRLASDEHILFVKAHHIIVDAWSLGLISAELYELYDARVRNGRPNLSASQLTYADLVRERTLREPGVVGAVEREEWLSRLRGVPRGELPVEPWAVRTGLDRQVIGKALAVSFSEERITALREFASEHRASLFMAMLAIMDVLVLRQSGAEKFLIGTTLANRNSTGASEIVGLFANTLPVLADCTGDPTFTELLDRVRDATIDVLDNQDAPFQGLLQSLDEERVAGRHPVFDIEFTLTHVDARTPLALPGVECTGVGIPRQGAKFDLAWELTERAGIVEGFVEFDSTLYSIDSVQMFIEQFNRILDQVVAAPHRRVSELDMLSPAQTQDLLRVASGTEMSLPPVLLHDLFARQARLTPDALAVIAEDASLTYRELDERANALAQRLREEGVTVEAPVGICLPRCTSLTIAVLAVLKAGGAYVPLDTSYPEDRIRFILDDSGARIAITDAAHEHLVVAHAAPLRVGTEQQPTPPPSSTTLRNLAYTIYTSGSTGRPKGVEVEHRGIVAYLVGLQERIPLTADDRVLQLTPFGFDISVYELFWPWLTGGATVLAPTNARQDVNLLAATCIAHRVTAAHCVPSYAPILAGALRSQDGEPSLRVLLCSAEALTDTVIQAVYAQLPEIELYNVYGATEASVDSTIWRHTLGHRGPVEVGMPIANTSMYVLDQGMNLLPPGSVGEAYLGGANVARGYLSRPGLTAERFVPDPFGAPGARLYRTGDLARRHGDGTTVFLGRLDNQVKVRGHRVELGEIEAVLQTHPAVKGAAVTFTDGRLIAYTVTEGELAPTQLREHLVQRLPRYMVPAVFIPLAELPQNSNGKLDRKALPKPDGSRPQLRQQYRAPAPGIATTIADAWSQVLGIERIGTDDNFFELGGDSILSIQMVSALAKRGISVTPRQIFDHQTIAELTAVATHTATHTTEDHRPVPLSPSLAPIQRWFFAQPLQRADHWNLSTATTLQEPVDLTALGEALDALAAHHDELRARFDRDGEGSWQQRLAEADAGQWPLTVLQGDSAEEITAALDTAQQGLSLQAGPLARAVLIRPTDGNGQSQLVLMCHHMVVDAVSWMILLEDLHTAYQQRLSAAPVKLPAKTTAYGQWAEDLATAVRAGALHDEVEFWNGLPTHTLRIPGLGGPDEPGTMGEKIQQYGVGVELSRMLKDRATRRHNASLEELLLAALVCALHGVGQMDGVSVLREIHGRQHEISDAETSRTVGWFTGMHPVTVGLADDTDVVSVLRDIKQQLRDMPRRGAGFLPLRQLTTFLDGLAEPSVTFNYLGRTALAIGAVAQDATPVGLGAERADGEYRPHLLDVVAALDNDELVIDWIAPGSVAARRAVDQLWRSFLEHLRLLALDTGPVAGDVIPLTATQEGVLFDVLYDDSESGRYIERLEYELSGVTSADGLRHAWQEVFDRHAMLRAKLVQMVGGGSRLESLPSAKASFTALHAVTWPEFKAIREGALNAPMRVTDESLIRMTVIRTPTGQYRLIWTFHHLLLDGWSAAVLLDELKTIYDARARGDVPVLSAVPRLTDYVSWLQRVKKTHEEHDGFWRKRLAGHVGTKTAALMNAASPEQPLPQTYEFDLPEAITAELASLARRLHITLNTVVHAAWALTLGAYTAESDVVFGATMSGRSNQFTDSERFVGMLINTLPVRIRCAPGQTVQDWLAEVQAESVEILERQHSSLPRIKSLVGDRGSQALFNTLVLFQNFPQPAENSDNGLSFRTLTAMEWTGYPLTLRIHPDDRLRADLTFDGRRPPLPPAAVAGTFVRVLQSIAEQSKSTTVGELRRISAEDRQKISEWNASAQATRTTVTLHQLMENATDHSPDAIAVIDGEQQWTYAELDRRANRFGHRLLEQGTAGGKLIGVCLRRSADLIAVLLGIMKAGFAYVPLDPALPRERVEYIVEDAGITTVICDEQFSELFEESVPEVVTLCQAELERISALNPGRPCSTVGPQDLAYAIYTSGSTGQPKGVAIEHGGSTDRLASARRLFEIAPGDRVLARTPISFDISVWEILLPLSVGATVVMSASNSSHHDGYWPGLIRDQQVSVAQFTPSGLIALAEDATGADYPSVRLLLLGGERLDPQVVIQAAKLFPHARIVNMYGPTESSVWATWWDCGRSRGESVVPIGRPLHNVAVYVLDDQGNEVPVGGVGELCLGGIGSARGYLSRPGLTAERFVPDPFGAPGARLYRTGDLARRHGDGTTVFLGRLDNQVKVRGHRVELGEIEAVLQTHPAVKGAAVTFTDGRLIAYTVTEGELAPTQLREHLVQRLPRYMVPAVFIPLAELPQNSNGKLDRKALPKPDGSRPQLRQQYRAPAPGIATTIADAWSQVLGIERIGTDDNFFELGGDSILSIQMVSALAKRGISVTPRQIFDHQTIAELTTVATHTATHTTEDQAPLVEVTDELASLLLGDRHDTN
ncbi:amino acid adenylation domain-containing protein [Streptomyces canus]|uniref:amino acid adenylation domain-containing protein n=1 Tax=Streptomyces canus TaxID=58343 RepID=UPI0038695D6B|nr:amino acid adenylation domain-containing protein [Streptomyces canus]